VRKWLFGISFLLSLSAFAQTDERAVPESAAFDHAIEVGGVAGWPVGLGFVVGYWGPTKGLPLVARFSTGFGTNFELGWGFANSRGLRAFVGGSAGMIGYLNLLSKQYYTAGPIVGLRFDRALWEHTDITVTIGPCASWSTNTATSLSVTGSVSLSGLF
jgi:hypothetical protein